MAAPKIRIKRPAAAAAVVEEDAEEQVAATVEAEDEPTVEPETVEEEDVSPYEDLSVSDLQKELTSRGLDATGRRSALVARLEEDDAKPVAKAAPKVAPPQKVAPPAPKPVAAAPKVTPPAPKPAAAVAPKPAYVAPKVAPTPIVQPKAAADEVDNSDATVLANTTIGDLFDIMKSGHTLVISKDGDALILSLADSKPTAIGTTKATVAQAAASNGGQKLRGDAYWREVLSPEYYSWYYEDAGTGKSWESMTAEEKEAFVQSLGVTYEPNDDPRVNSLHQVTALLKHLGIGKYKEEYKSTKARDALRA